MGTVLIASSTTIAEIGVIVVILVLGVITFVMYRKQNAAAKPDQADRRSTRNANYYADVTTVPAPGAAPAHSDGDEGTTAPAPAPASPLAGATSTLPGGKPTQSDPFATLSTGSGAPSPAAAEATPESLESLPPPDPGTEAGWLTDPSGAADTLRYWDGNAWTAHVAQRS
jgi:hypothetical protein